MTFRVKTLPKAEADIRSIAGYLFNHSPQGAAAWLEALDQARTRLAGQADACAAAEEGLRFEIDIRQALFKTKHGRVYRLVFTIVGKEARILRVRGPGQAPINPDDVWVFRSQTTCHRINQRERARGRNQFVAESPSRRCKCR